MLYNSMYISKSFLYFPLICAHSFKAVPLIYVFNGQFFKKNLISRNIVNGAENMSKKLNLNV